MIKKSMSQEIRDFANGLEPIWTQELACTADTGMLVGVKFTEWGNLSVLGFLSDQEQCSIRTEG